MPTKQDHGAAEFGRTRIGAHGGNRTRDLSLTKGVLYHRATWAFWNRKNDTKDFLNFKTSLQTMERETGIEPASLAWKARVLPLNYSRISGVCHISETRQMPSNF